MLLQSLLCLTALLLGSTAADPLPPSSDLFYTPPDTWKSQWSGTILRCRQLPSIAANLNIHAAYQILYRTSIAPNGYLEPSYAVTTILVPPNANYDQVISYQTYYDSPVVNCAPSHAIQAGANDTTAISEMEMNLPAFLNRGIIVVTSDYEGVDAAYTAGPTSGYHTIDSIRAALRSNYLTGINWWARVAMFGYSGGSIATEYACELQPGYAPDLNGNLIGAAAGGLPVNLTASKLANNGGWTSGSDFAGFQGLANGYPDFATCLEAALIPSKSAAFHAVHNDCNYGSDFWWQDIFSYFQDGSNFLYSSCWTDLVNKAGIMGVHGTPRIPMYIFKGTADEVVPSIEETDALVQQYCSDGAQITYVRYNGGTHTGTNSAGTGPAFDYLFNLFGGGSAPSGCSTTTV